MTAPNPASASFRVANAADWQANWDAARSFLPPAGIREVPNAIVLPLLVKNAPGTRRLLFEGGLCDSDGAFIAGRRRSISDETANFSALWPYQVDPTTVETRDDEVIFGGVLFDHYGHILTDSTARLWYAIAHPEKSCKIVFVSARIPRTVGPEDPLPLFELAGIDPGRIEVIGKPTRFRNVIVPDESVYSLESCRPEWISFFDAVRARVEPSPYRKVYFSRTRFKRNDVFNEDLFESYYRENGFHVVHPEDCTLREEISFAAGADEIVATIGTLSHQFLFCRPGAHATILLRTPNVVRLQLLVCAARGLRSDFVDASRNVLPTYHSDGVFYLAPTPRFKGFLAASGLPPFGAERCREAYSASRVGPYVEKWLRVFGQADCPLHFSSSPDYRSLGGLAALGAALSAPEDFGKLSDGLASLVLSKLKSINETDVLRWKLKKATENPPDPKTPPPPSG